MELNKIVFYLFLATICLELLGSSHSIAGKEPDSSNDTVSEVEKTANSLNPNRKALANPLIIEYCQTCSYRGRVNEIRAALNEVYKDVKLIEEEFPVPAPWPMVSQLLSYFRIAGLALLFAGDHLFAYMQMNYPPWYLWIKNNKFNFGIFLFFGVNMLSNWMVSTGAFEVIYNGTILYSGIQTKTLPTAEEIIILVNEVVG